MAKKFTWNAWNFDGDGEAYIIDKAQCTNKDDVPDYICREDDMPEECKPYMVIEEGWCKYQVRSDWDNGDGPTGGYLVEQFKNRPKRADGSPQRGWFPVWIVRKGEWY